MGRNEAMFVGVAGYMLHCARMGPFITLHVVHTRGLYDCIIGS